ncbi:ABC transporter substrate-binding protein [Halalkalibacterium halodurans]|uniref:ABC transporter substrate-binding protein n=1 Tax=Halalkalibacterium halodurans TaxID=86665 RepID=UPI0006A9DCA8|nr:ABC transporter substrate-binding protein [Halalkalibacterium halodurans]TPE71020.1 carbohydrate ABC transporter substrate-binding protein [Halalkalibacterium halodurans]
MKKMKLLSVGFVSALLLVGCNGQQASDNDPESPTSEDQVELVFWEFGNTGYDKLIAEYEEENPHVKINLQNSDMNDLHDNLFTSISAGSGAPDITMIEEAQMERYRNAEQAFHNLYEFGAENVQDQYLDWVWRRGENADGTFMFGLPTDIGPTVMYYRADVFEEAGFDSSPEAVSELVATWDDFERVADEIYEKTGKQMADGAELIYNAKRDQAKQQYFNEEDQLIIEDHEHIRDAFDYTARLLDKGVIGDIPLWTPEWFAGMGDGSYATMLAPAWMQGVIKDNEPEEGVWSISTMPEGAGNWGGSYVAIPAESEHPEEAYKFVEWLTAPEQQLKSFLDYGLFPSAPAVYEMSEFMDYEDAYFGGLKTAQIFSEAAQAVEPVYKGRNYYPIDEEIKQAIDNVAAGSEPDDEWEAAIKRIQDVLNRQ